MTKKKKTQKAKTTRQISDDELVKVIDTITKKLAYKFKFGYHDIDDMRQQISIFALEGLSNYDYERPLENFLWTHVRNRLFNYKRDNYQRPDKPCYSCPLFDRAISDCTKYANKQDCDLYSVWYNRNQNKKKLMHLTTINEVKDYGNLFFFNNSSAENIELFNFLDEHLTGEIRSIYIRLKHGNKITTNEKNKLADSIKEILWQKKEDS